MEFDSARAPGGEALALSSAQLGIWFAQKLNPASPAFNTGLWTISQALLNLSCQGNSTAELNGVSIRDKRSEGKVTGTAVLSYKPDEHSLLYASYSRGYKAGGFNLDRSALKAPALPFSTYGGAQALVHNLQFAPETVTLIPGEPLAGLNPETVGFDGRCCAASRRSGAGRADAVWAAGTASTAHAAPSKSSLAKVCFRTRNSLRRFI